MEANCPHLRADMSHAEIEECDTGVVAVCPWHRCVRPLAGKGYLHLLISGADQVRLRLEDGTQRDGAQSVHVRD